MLLEIVQYVTYTPLALVIEDGTLLSERSGQHSVLIEKCRVPKQRGRKHFAKVHKELPGLVIEPSI